MYIAIWRGAARRWSRRPLSISLTVKPWAPATVSLILAIVTRCSGACAIALLSTSAASSMVIGDFVSEAYATTRISAPSSSRMFDGMTLAMNDVTSSGTGNLFAFGFLAQNRFARFEVRRLNVGEQDPTRTASAGATRAFESLCGGRSRRNDQLPAGFVQRVEGVEELFLRRFFACEELNVVDQQHVDLAVAVAKLGRAVVLQRDDELVGELLAGEVHDVGVRDCRSSRDGRSRASSASCPNRRRRTEKAGCTREPGRWRPLEPRRARTGWSCRRRTLRNV